MLRQRSWRPRRGTTSDATSVGVLLERLFEVVYCRRHLPLAAVSAAERSTPTVGNTGCIARRGRYTNNKFRVSRKLCHPIFIRTLVSADLLTEANQVASNEIVCRLLDIIPIIVIMTTSNPIFDCKVMRKRGRCLERRKKAASHQRGSGHYSTQQSEALTSVVVLPWM